jgi:hypothetical protein
LEREQKLLRALDSICRVALAAFSYLVNPALFLTSFYAGVALSVGYVLFTQGGDQLSGSLRPFCGQGYMEFLSGKVFPQWAVRIVTTAFIAAHVRHDPQFFVPFSGLFIGWWAGAEVGTLAWSWGRKIMAYQAPTPGASANCGCH